MRQAKGPNGSWVGLIRPLALVFRHHALHPRAVEHVNQQKGQGTVLSSAVDMHHMGLIGV